MNAIAPAAVYRSPDPQQQNVNNNPPERSFVAPYTANVFGGTAKFQPIPTVSFYSANLCHHRRQGHPDSWRPERGCERNGSV